MDADRKSTVSSFYGRKNSLDALNSDFPPSSGNQQSQRRDDASSFFHPTSPPVVAPAGSGRFGSAGYNRNSFFNAGREEPLKPGRDEEEEPTGGDGWDVYADFNNAGPRYSSTAFGNSDGYARLEGTPKSESSPALAGGPVELVTVPALGPEWQKDEMREMTKAGRRERKAEGRRRHWKEWNRDQKGLWGKKWLTRKSIAICLFVFCALVVIILVITLPRVPGVLFNGDHPLLAANGTWNNTIPTQFSASPTNFTFPALAQLQLDTGSSFIPITFSHMSAEIYDSDTNRLVGSGQVGRQTIGAKQLVDIQVPMNFTYAATNTSDQTWKNWHAACLNTLLYPDGKRPGLNFRIVFNMGIVGLIGDKGTSTMVTNADCPVELPTSAS